MQNIDQFAFQTDCLSPGGTRTPIGFAEGHLYIVSGAPGQDLCLKRVDPRYGFYEEAADLGAIDYNDIASHRTAATCSTTRRTAKTESSPCASSTSRREEPPRLHLPLGELAAPARLLLLRRRGVLLLLADL